MAKKQAPDSDTATAAENPRVAADIVPRRVRLQRATTGTPVESRTRDELEQIARDAGLDVEGTGADGYVTADDLVGAIRGATSATVTRRSQPLQRTEGEPAPADTRTED